jgi:ribA/ribD-fused uncharacterized protein
MPQDSDQCFKDQFLSINSHVIGFYERQFYFLSNFSSFSVEFEGVLYPTSEHAYQSQKFLIRDSVTGAILNHELYDIFLNIWLAKSAHDALKIARKNKSKIRSDWDDIKVDVMESICLAKAQQHEYIQKKLLMTEDRYLVEDSYVDSFWGWGPDRQGGNKLGEIWMRIRDRLRNS